jgi:hypothetical protein
MERPGTQRHSSHESGDNREHRREFMPNARRKKLCPNDLIPKRRHA